MILNVGIGTMAVALAVLGGILSAITLSALPLIKWSAIGLFAVLGVASVVLVIMQARITQRDQEAATTRQERLQKSLDETRLDAAKATSFLSGQVATLADLIAHPPPNQDLRDIAQEIRAAGSGVQHTNAQWKEAASNLAGRLREFQTKITQESARLLYTPTNPGIGEALRRGDKDEAARLSMERGIQYSNLYTRQQNEFGQLRAECLETRTQLLARLPPQTDSDELSRNARMVLDHGMLAGPRPVGDLADYFDRLAARLPAKSGK